MKINIYCDLCRQFYEIELGQTWLDVWLCPHVTEGGESDGNDC